MSYNLAVLGAGPGGYVAAIRAAQLGLKTCLIEEKRVGGTCLNVGCIPTKFLLTASRKYSDIMDMERFGLVVQDCAVDMERMMAGKNDVVGRLVKGVQYLIKKNKIDLFEGRGTLVNKNEIRVENGDKTETINADKIIIATGTSPALPAIFGHDGSFVYSSDEALSWSSIPDRLIIIGGGVIGCEFATIFSNLGSQVTIIELLPSILANFDAELSRFTAAKFGNMGVGIITGVKVAGVEKAGTTVKAILEDGKVIEADRILVSIGRSANISGIGLESLGIKIDAARKKIAVDEYMKTNVDNIYAIGDACNSPYDLAHVAMKEGIVAAENAAGEKNTMDYRCVPNCVFTNPEFATVGYTLNEAKEKGIDAKAGKFSFMANGKALSLGEAEGFVKVIIDSRTDEVIGAQIIGPHATDLIAEAAILVQNRGKGHDIMKTIHAHPTLAEAVWEAVESAYGRAIHS